MSDAAAGPPAIVVQGLTKRYGGAPAVDHLDLEVAAGETFALLGPNGAGKTTTVECLEGYRRPDAGSVRVLGLDPRGDARHLRPRIGLMLQDGGIYPLAKPGELLRLFAAFHRQPLPVADLLERVGLAAARGTRYRDLSGGQQQRLSLALALVGRPEVVFLDEPTAGLDPAARRVTWELIGELRAAGVTIVLTTHLLDEAERLADRVAIVDHGRLVALGTPDELTHGDRAEIEFTARPGLDVDGLAATLGVPVSERAAGRYHLDAPNQPALIARLTAWLADHDEPLGELTAGKRSLEDVFLRLTAEHADDPAAPEAGVAGDGRPDDGSDGDVEVAR